MCGRFEQSETREYYARALGGIQAASNGWGAYHSQYNLSPGTAPLILHTLKERWIPSASHGAITRRRMRKRRGGHGSMPGLKGFLTGRYFRHMFREGRVIIPGGVWYECALENGKKQPWHITRKDREPIFMAGLTNFRPVHPANRRSGIRGDCDPGLRRRDGGHPRPQAGCAGARRRVALDGSRHAR